MGDLPLTVIGIDCAADPANVGLARGIWEGDTMAVKELGSGSKTSGPAETVAGWLGGGGPALLALDAPLGWPQRLANALREHRAGQPLALDPPNPQPDPGQAGYVRDANLMFRRETDRFVREHLGQQPLDVGADRIARAAMAALELLQKVRQLSGVPIELAWDSAERHGVRAIEVYPAATLRAHGITHRGYKRTDQGPVRDEIAGLLRERRLVFNDSVVLSGISSHTLDAAVCLLAARDFLSGDALPPPGDLAPAARREGWIWVRGGSEGPQAPPRKPLS